VAIVVTHDKELAMDKKRLTTADFDPEVLGLFDRYVHGLIDRREFLRATGTIVGSAAAVGVLAALAPSFAAAEQVKPTDSRIKVSRVEFDSPKGYGKCQGYMARPAAGGAAPMVLVAHENRGLNPHIEDIARRLAVDGFIAFAPDALHPLGGYPGDEDAARTLFQKLDQDKVKQDFIAAAGLLSAMSSSSGKLGATGFCWGGGMTNFLATQLPNLLAAAPFYGSAPPTEDVAKTKAELLVVLAADDERINAGWPAYKEALDKAGVKYELLQPAGTVHGFNNDTTPRYNEIAAHQAWSKTLALFKKKLGSDT
jgi:carboxymethylenebutenolidase